MANPALLLPLAAAALGACASLVEPEPPARSVPASAAARTAGSGGSARGETAAALLPGSGTTRLDLGVFAPRGDLGDLDDGVFAQVAFGRELASFLSVEASIGYLEADGTNVLGAADVD